MSKNETLIAKEYVYLGSTRLQSGGRAVRFCPLITGTRQFGPELCYKHRRRFTIGGIYEIPTTADGGHASLTAAIFKGLYPDQELRIEWEAREQAQEAALRALKLEKQSKNAIETAIEPIRRIYHRTDALGRLALELLVLRSLRKHPNLD